MVWSEIIAIALAWHKRIATARIYVVLSGSETLFCIQELLVSSMGFRANCSGVYGIKWLK
jgi:hypothetical protein